jgi:hypothetical protein
MTMPTPIERCDFERDGKKWVCRGGGNCLGEITFGHGKTRKESYDDYVRTREHELADALEADADEAEMVQADYDEAPEDGSLRDAVMFSADVVAMREKAKRLRGN